MVLDLWAAGMPRHDRQIHESITAVESAHLNAALQIAGSPRWGSRVSDGRQEERGAHAAARPRKVIHDAKTQTVSFDYQQRDHAADV